MTCTNVSKLIELIDKLDLHPCLGLNCDGHCTKKCAAGGGHNIGLINFYKNKLIDIVQKQYITKKNIYEYGLYGAEECNNIDDLKRDLDNAYEYLKKIVKLYEV